MEDGRILMGVIGRPHGVRGLVRVHSYAEKDLAGYAPLQDERGRAWSLDWRGDGIAELRDDQGRPLPDRTAAEALVNTKLYVSRARLAAPEPDEFYWSDLVGLQAVDAGGATVGRVVQVHDYGAGPSLEIEGGLLIPFTAACVPVVDVAAGRLVIALPEAVETLIPREREIEELGEGRS